jgi:hypothetical protein
LPAVRKGKGERRRFGRIRLDHPMNGRFGEAPVQILDISITGALIAHEGRRPQGEQRRLTLEWEERTLELTCAIVRSTVWRLARGAGEQSVYHSGLRLIEASAEAQELLREVIAARILRALEEQKANARGVPPLAAYMYQPGKGDLFRRCELMDGTWRRTETTHPQQPANGFTVAADVPPEQVDMLCETWETTTAEGRRLTRLLAELSISKAEGVPVRRYVP